MIAFGSSITEPEVYRVGRAGHQAGGRSRLRDRSDGLGRVDIRSYNALLDQFADREGLEALVLVHQDAEIVDSGLLRDLRDALTDPDVGLVGCVGAVGVRSIAWWEASVTLASFINRYDEHGGGDLPSFSWAWNDAPAYARVGEVETLDGFVLVALALGVANIRFDEELGEFHGYDLDFCLQVRGRTEGITADFRAIHHRQLDMVPDPEEWIDAHVKLADKWDGRMGIGTGAGNLEASARCGPRPIPTRAAARHMNSLEADAQARELERAIAETTGSVSWRITAPLRDGCTVAAPTGGAGRRSRLTPRSPSAQG